ncbi:hypothetical protein [uncultured Lactobacillus sp.]|uniref:hypothetical protein n=1 Tax=uncultured Lactobacillus sp. TaxID=153152 RepID=UPI002639B3A4|nr:hypothetical protein [uncultured Lactobacillus sp.]
MSRVPYALLIGIENQLESIFNTKQELIDLTQYFAKSVGKEVPLTDVVDGTKREILRKNIGCLSDDEIFDFMSQLEKLSYIKYEEYLCEEIDELLSYQDNGSSKSRGSITDLLSCYPQKIKNQWRKACLFFDKGDYRESLDDIRLTIELLVKEITRSEKSLENQKSNLGKFFKVKGINNQIVNLFWKMLDMYMNIQNDEAKHDVPENLGHEEITFLMNQASLIIRFLVDCDSKEF